MTQSTLPQNSAPQPAPAGQHVDGQFVQYADFIEQQIADTRGRVKWVELFSESLALALGASVYLFAAVVVDHWLVEGGLGFRSRLLAFAGLMGLGGYFLWRRIIPLLTLRINPLYAAEAIEKFQPSLKNSLINFLLLRKSTAPMPKVVYDAVEARAANDLTQVPVEGAVDRTRLIKAGYAAIALVAIAAVYSFASPKSTVQSVTRVVFPWADLGAPTRVDITEVTPGNAMAFTGDTVTVRATVTGLRAEDKVFVRYTTEDGSVVDEPVEMTPRDYRHEAVLPPEGPGGKGLGQSLRYCVQAGDFRTPEYYLEVQPPPAILVEALEYDYPEYTGLTARTEKGHGDIKAIEGTHIVVRAAANQVIRPKSALLDYDADGKAPHLILEAEKDPRRVWGAFTLNLTKSGVQEHSQYLLRFKNEAGLLNPNPIRYRIDVIADAPPTVEFAAPARDVELPVNDKLEMDIRAADQDFALSQVYLRIQRPDGKDLLGTIDEPGLGLIQLQLGEKSPQKFEGKYVLEPAKLGLSIGDEVVYWAAAYDNKGTSKKSRRGLPNIVETQKWRVKIVPPAQPKPMPNELAKNEPRNDQKQQPNEQKQPGQGERQPGQNNQDPRQRPEKPPTEPLGDKTSPTSKAGTEQQQQQDEQPNPERDPGKVFDEINKLREEQEKARQPREEKTEEGKQPEPKPMPKEDDQQQLDEQQDRGGQSGKQNSGEKQGNKQGDKEGKKGDKSQPGEKQGNEKKPGVGGEKTEPQNQSDPQQQLDEGEKKGLGEKQGDQQNTEKQPGAGEKQGEKQPGAGQKGEKQPGQKGTEQQPQQQLDEEQNTEKKAGEKQGDKQPGKKEGGEKREGNPGEKQDGEKGAEKRPGQKAEKQPGAGGEKSSQPQEQTAPQQQLDEEKKQGTPKEGGGTTKEGGPKQDGEKKADKGTDEKQEGGQREKAEGGSEGRKQEQGGPTPASQGKEDPKDKSGQQDRGQGQQANKENNASSPSNSNHNSNTQGENEGDKSGAGKAGGGQAAKQQGKGTAGSNTEAQNGGQAGKESGEGEQIDRAGNKGPSKSKTGATSTDKPGEGSKSRKTDGPGDSQAPKEVAGKAEKTDAKKATTEHKGQRPKDVDSQGSKAGEGPAKGETKEGEAGPGTGTPMPGGGEQQGPGNGVNREPFQNDPVNLNETVEGVDLALKHIKDELAKPRPDPSLIKMFGSREEAQKYHDQWKAIRDQALQPGADNAEKRRQAEEALRGLGIQRGGAKTDTARTARDTEGRNRERTVVPPPPGYRERTSGFKTGISKPVAEPK